MPRYKVDFDGLDHVQEALGISARRRLKHQLAVDIEEGTRETADQAADNAPVLTGALRSSILASVQREGKMNYIFGSTMPYAQRQEYEHDTKAGYFRRAIWAKQPEIGDKIGFTVRRALRR